MALGSLPIGRRAHRRHRRPLSGSSVPAGGRRPNNTQTGRRARLHRSAGRLSPVRHSRSRRWASEYRISKLRLGGIAVPGASGKLRVRRDARGLLDWDLSARTPTALPRIGRTGTVEVDLFDGNAIFGVYDFADVTLDDATTSINLRGHGTMAEATVPAGIERSSTCRPLPSVCESDLSLRPGDPPKRGSSEVQVGEPLRPLQRRQLRQRLGLGDHSSARQVLIQVSQSLARSQRCGTIRRALG